MKLEGIMLSEVSQIGKEQYHVTSLTCGIYRNNNKEAQR